MITNKELLNAGRRLSKKPLIKLTATVEHNGEIFALTSSWSSFINNTIKIGVVRPDYSGDAYLATLSENPL